MKQILGIWLPDGDEHFKHQLPIGPMVEGKATYQLKKYLAAMSYVVDMGHAVDVGGHVGLWSRVMARDFKKVTTFEPLSVHRECFKKNVEAKNVYLFPYAMGSVRGSINIHMPNDNTGNSHVNGFGEKVEMLTLDSMGLSDVDFLKIDVEGFEYDVLEGGRRLIQDNRPVIIIEQKPDNAERYGHGRYDAVALLKSWGMREAQVISGDHIMVWK